MARPLLFLACALALLACSSVASADTVKHSFHIKNVTVERLCKQHVITAVNDKLPGPIIKVHEGDTLEVKVVNMSPYNITIHWHGIFQILSGWSDGPEYTTQCPILPGTSYTYKFTITGQEGTLWWHAHVHWLRATVHGALIIRPKTAYPFPKPHKEFPILLGEWWNSDINTVYNQGFANGGLPNNSDAFTINGQPGALYPCSSSDTYNLTVEQGRTYLLRIINAALNTQLFFKIANHNMTVVAVDASYTAQLVTDVVVVSPGQTTDVLITANQPPASYYMAAHAYASAPGVAFDNTTTTGIIVYKNSKPSTPVMPAPTAFNDTPAAFKFNSNLTGLVTGPHWTPVPTKIDENMFVTVGLGLSPCAANATCVGPLGMNFAANMNNASFQFPTKLSMLQAFFGNVGGIYTTDFPDNPPLVFDYTNSNINGFNTSILPTLKSTKVKKLKFNSTVQIVFQNTALISIENHPIHLHGFNFHVLAQGFGNYDAVNAPKQFNLVNPQVRNTIGVPVGGWAVIRFTANNPGLDIGKVKGYQIFKRLKVDQTNQDSMTVPQVQNLTIQRLCNQHVITAVNGGLPGPLIEVHEGDTLVVHVFNKSPYNISIHWHGIFQILSGWADGPEYVTQCPILPGTSYTYTFNITGQEGTLWWHAHVHWLRATVYGALIIRPKKDNCYPFQKPDGEFPILLGEWWNSNINDVYNQGFANGLLPNNSDAFTINGQPGALYPCSSSGAYNLTVEQGKTYLLRIINAALNTQLFFKIANHNMTVVAVDASYTAQMVTDVVVVSPGQTTDVLITANQPPASYYMAAHAYASAPGAAPGTGFDNTTTTGVIVYKNSKPSTPVMPALPAFNDTPTAFKFNSNLTGLVNGPHWIPVPLKIDEHMFVTVGLGLSPCAANATCLGPSGMSFSANMNNASFQFPTKLSMLQAFFNNVGGIYTTDFPDNPPLVFDYTNSNNGLNTSILTTLKSSKVKKLKFNSTVQIVFQNTALITLENHPIHLHGFNFHVLAQGFGNYDVVNAPKQFNLVNPQIRNTIGVPVGGWAVIRFTANNPGVWLMHCHLDIHLPLGLATAFVVENGPTLSTTLPPPPSDLPKC
ncbi:hypothetical protein Vadar_033564 [Vaccinium darrowii]|uniref:Uncharacterized protein n=1 Tax=Vaccinium darrowii TaxID=229202 RepID=A0ACB7ZPN3_9ERIC|nr:hypothetical protein Vadar_033564 [Vaccinium darrowii]